MPLDHYVSQVHLKQFRNPETRLLSVVRKSNLKSFPTRTQDVCKIEDGSTNSYLIHDRAVEEFLTSIEPYYDGALEQFRSGKPSKDAVYVMGGFAAYVASCSPTGMRLQASPLRHMVESEAILLERIGKLGPPPPQLGASVFDALTSGKLKVTVDEKYPQAIGILNILQSTATLGNFRWEILKNRHTGSPFLTSDYPIAMEMTRDVRVLNRIVPLAPDIAIRIVPSLDLDLGSATFDFKTFRYRVVNVSEGQVQHVNRLIVRCAEDFVFCSQDCDWHKKLTERNRHFGLEMLNDRFPIERGVLLLARQRIVERKAAA
jgi:hypothetical protein